ncbi:uncharacterized protein LOC132631807 [Lycium barbarum]|uniref:uncharacterized protein LOC132631807 n=1 Tax=Lycium barbarum TaxID=112863 RepID=UPI00293E9BC7|nr:uncharacterized protein LOC132631807 [Lycium barbarum]
MGNEWLYWGSSGSGTSKRSSQKGRRTKEEEAQQRQHTQYNTTKSRGEEVLNNEEATQPGGCMCFQIFELPHLQLALNQQSRSLKPHHHTSFIQQDQEPSFLKGVEAPRNSLELDEPVVERKSVSSSLSSSSTMKIDDQNLNIPVGIQIRTSCDSRSPRVSTSTTRTRTDHDISSECSSSSPAGTKTPTLVARLMGLDLLPENNSPRISISTTCNTKSHSKNVVNNHQYSNSSKNRRFSNFESSDTNYITGTLSLPETPRISLARRSDVEHHHHQHQHHHRLSLQINKENMGDVFDFSDSSSNASVGRKMARSSTRRRSYHDQENENQIRSPGYYARQIVKQVKESVSRKVGHDITNTSTGSTSFRRKDDLLAAKYDQVVLLKPKKKSHGDHDDFIPSKQTTPSCSPRFRFLEPKSSSTKHQPVSSCVAKSQTTSHSPRFSPLSPLAENTTLPAKIVTKPKPQTSPKEQVQQNSTTIQKRKVEKVVPKKPPQACDAIRSKKEEPFVRSAAATNKANFGDKKCKKTPLSNQLVNTTSTVPTILPLRKDPSPPPTKLFIKQSESSEESDTIASKRSTQTLSSNSSHSYKLISTLQDRCNGANTIISGECSIGAEFQYIQRILKHTGIDKSTPLSLAKWYSTSHPLDPSIFHYFELFTTSTLTLRCNRKLIFQLVDELLVEILKPSGKFKKRGQLMHGKELIDMLCMRIRSFPKANCQVLEDIDALIDNDMQKSEIGIGSGFLEEEVESIVCEIERDIMKELVHDITV